MQAPAFGWGEGNGLTPNYLWPADGSWCLGTNIDLDSSILGGGGRPGYSPTWRRSRS